MTRSRRLFLCYAATVVLVFVAIEVYLARSHSPELPPIIEWLTLPGVLIAAFGLVGAHSDSLELAMTIANIGVYTAIPYLIWKVLASRRNPQ